MAEMLRANALSDRMRGKLGSPIYRRSKQLCVQQLQLLEEEYQLLEEKNQRLTEREQLLTEQTHQLIAETNQLLARQQGGCSDDLPYNP